MAVHMITAGGSHCKCTHHCFPSPCPYGLVPGAVQAEACVLDCSSALEADPGRVKAYFRRALAREKLGEDGDALRDAKRALEVQVCTV